MAALQAALDDWYAMRLAEIDKILSDSVKPPQKTKDALEKERGELLKGLGDPKDAGAAAKAQQKKNSDKDFEELKKKKEKGKKPKDILKDKIAKALKDLQDCEANCAEGEGSPTPTPTPTPGPIAEVSPPPPFEIQVPPLPPCFETKAARAAHRKTLEELQPKLGYLKKQYAAEYLTPPANDAWKEWGDKLKKAIDDVSDQLSKVDTVPVTCPTPTPTPTPARTGGGGTSKPTPTPKGKPKRQRTTTGHNISFDDGGAGLSEDFCALISENKIRIDDTFGTGETIGHVADLVIENLTDQPIEVTIPPMVLESRSRKNQHYGSRGGDTVEVPPHSKKKVPLDGICLARNKPPVGNNVGGDLAINDCDSDVHISHDDAHRMMRIAESKYEAADKLEEEGKLKDMPYRDPKKRKEIVEQWSTWMDPRISEITGAPPATKDDLKKVVYKQVEEQGPVTPEKKKKLDDGIDTLWDKIELTTKKAKDLEKPAENEEAESPPIGGGTFNVTNDTPTPAPQTQEKKKKGKKKKKNYPKPIQEWVDKYNAAQDAEEKKQAAKNSYDWAKKKYFDKSKHHADLEKARDDAKKKADAPGATPQDKSDYDKAQKELDKNEKALEKDFQQTDDGKKAFDEYHEAEKGARNAQDEAKKAEDKLPPGVDKDGIKKYEDERKRMW